MNLPELLTVADFCNRYSIGKTSFYREVNAGRLKIRKFGTATRIARIDAQAWVESLPLSQGGGRMMENIAPEKGKALVAATTKGQPKTVEANGNSLIAEDCQTGNWIVAFRAADGATFTYRGKRGRVLAMLARHQEGVTQHDTYPWHTRLGGTIHAMRQDGLTISTELEGRYRHARYRLAIVGSLIKQAENREAAI